jgi:hypothetical protein
MHVPIANRESAIFSDTAIVATKPDKGEGYKYK